ncbi:triacylglycerol lipase, partial [Massospora cicadina]
NLSEPTPIEVLKRKLAESKSYAEYKKFGTELDGTKSLIEEYISAVNQQFERIGHATQNELTAQQKLDFIHDSRHSFGTTALILHGGSTFGLCHIGVVKSLFEQDLLPKEAYKRTNRVLNITVSPTRKNEVPQLLNYLTAPNAPKLIRSAACASAAILGLYDSVDLLIKDESGEVVPWNSSAIRWANGQTSEIDSPLNRLSELFNVNHFIVSQANPYIIPFMSKELQLQDDRLLSRVRNVFYSEIGYRLRQV